MLMKYVTPKHRKYLTLSACLLGFSSLAWWVVGGAAARTDEQPVAVSSEIVARGRIEPSSRVLAIHGAADGSVIRELKVGQGDVVARGDVLAVLDGYEMRRADLLVAEQNLRLAELQRTQITAGAKGSEKAAQRNAVAAKEAQLTRLRLEWDRRNSLVAQGFASKQSLEALKAELDQVQSEVEQARHTLTALSETRGIDDEVAVARVVLAKASLERAQADVEHTLIRAPIAGTILSIQARAGEAIGQDGLLRMAALDQIVVVAEVDEGEVARLKLGMEATIEAPILKAPITAKVGRIAQEVFRQKRPASDVLIGRDAKVVEVDLIPEKALPFVMGAEVLAHIRVDEAGKH
jgi:HlyD family secretion protein